MHCSPTCSVTCKSNTHNPLPRQIILQGNWYKEACPHSVFYSPCCYDMGTSWVRSFTWWRHQMEKFSALLAICAGNSPVPGEFPTQRPVARSFDVFLDLRLNKRLRKQSWGDLRRHLAHYDVIVMIPPLAAPANFDSWSSSHFLKHMTFPSLAQIFGNKFSRYQSQNVCFAWHHDM